MNILFVNFPTLSPENVQVCFTRKPTPYMAQIPLGIVHLAGAIKNLEFIENIECLDYCLELENGPNYGNYQNFIDRLADEIMFEPDLIAYSINFSTQHDFFVRTEKRLFKRWPNSTSVAGGTHATNVTLELLGTTNLDYVIRGEAELSFVQFINNIQAGKVDKLCDIQGVYSKFHNSLEPLKISEYADLPDLPLPNWHLFDMERYKKSISETFLYGSERYSCSIMTSRGCPFHCTFCSSFTLHGRKMRYFGAEWVTKMVTQLNEEYGINEFVIQDDMFTVHTERTLEMLSALQGLGIPDIGLSVKNALSVNTLNEPVVDALASTGLETAYLAIESGSQHVNNNIIKKRVNLKRVPDIIKMFRERDVPTVCFFIMGFPGETKEMIAESISYAESICSDWCTFNAVKPLVGTPLYDEMLSEGYIDHTPEQWNQTAYGLREFDTKEISAEELNDILYEANIRINFIQNYNVKIGNYSKAAKMFKSISDQYQYHVVALYMLYICSKGLGNADASMNYLRQIYSTIDSDPRAANMYAKYREHMPDITVEIKGSIDTSSDFRSNSSTKIAQNLELKEQVIEI